jgi:hypothetical protein
MKPSNQLVSAEEKRVMQWQSSVAVCMFVLFLPTAILSVYIFNGSFKPAILPILIGLFLIGVSSIRNQVSIARPKGQKEPTRGTSAIGIGLFLLVVAFIQFLFVFIPPFSGILSSVIDGGFRGFAHSTLDNLPVYNDVASTSPLYRAAESAAFTEINTFTHISIGGHGKAVPLAIIEDIVLLAGNISTENRFGRNSNLINASVETGNVNWQTVSGSQFIATDSNRVYVVAPKQLFGGAAGVAAYDARSGEKNWETTFDWKYAMGIRNLTITDSGINTQTFHRAEDGFYILDKEHGEITTFINGRRHIFAIENGVTYEWGGNLKASGQINWEIKPNNPGFYDRDLATPIIESDLIIVKDGHTDHPGGSAYVA